MYFDYKKWLVRISNPFSSKKTNKYYIVRDMISIAKKNKSFVPIRYCFILLKDYKQIIENKKLSIHNQGAFLNKKEA